MSASDDHRTRLRLGNVVFDPSTCRLMDRDGNPIAVREQSLRVLRELAARNGETVEKDDLVSAVWAGTSVSDDSLVQCIKDIRAALGDSDRQLLRTAVGRGYSLHGVHETPVSPGAHPKLLICALRVQGDAPDLVELAEVITEEMIIALSPRAGHRVTTDETQRETALYAINGRVSRSDDKMRVFVQVVRGGSGDVVFAETWNVAAEDAGRLPRIITDKIGNFLRVHMSHYASEDYATSENDDLDTQGLLTKAAYHMGRFQTYNRDQARAALSEAIEREPANAVALAMRASMATQLIPQTSLSEIPDTREYCIELAERAVGIAPHIDFVIRTRGNLRFWLLADHDGACADCKRALDISPLFHLARLTIATSEILSGQHREGTARMRAMMDLVPSLDPQFPLYFALLALGHFLAGDADTAVQTAREGHDRAPGDPWCNYVYATVAADRERITKTEEFQRMVASIDLPFTHFRDLPFTDMRDVDLLEERLTHIGYPRSS